MEDVAAAEPESSQRVRWGIPEVMFGLLMSFSFSTLVVVLYTAIAGQPTGGRVLPVVILSFLANWSALLGTLWWATHNRGTGSFRRDFGLSIVLPRDVGRGIFWGLASQIVLLPVVYLPVKYLRPDLWDKMSEPAEQLTAVASNLPAMVALGFCLVVLAPLVEELFFRGLALRSFESRFGKLPGLVFTSVIFAAIHLQVLQFVGLFAFGLVLGILASRNGRLGESIVAHVAFNAVTVITIYTGLNIP